MPDARTRNVLLGVGLLGMLFACSGLLQIVFAPSMAAVAGARIWLLIAALILTPLLFYLTGMRRRSKRAARRIAAQQLQDLDAATVRLRTPEGIRAAGGADQPPDVS